ncbi:MULTISPECIES: hypothetical protein [Flavobacteriaceae]|uniref:hypothetical protein n=1 Tax=Flavobacteriaceae TaxID=49546 RepID=UPI001492CC6E|nr:MULTISPECIES: hypothetical protein [Allomuricauda]MDC6364824.1 hypothetical protein [Muricauda sp. AC10]
MGYELSIQREENQTKLSKEEWVKYVKSDFEFKPIETFSAKIEEDKYLTIPTPNAGLWKADGKEVPFTFDEEFGWISVKNPDKRIIRKMVSIADKLDAIVLGEEGEIYDKDDLEGKQAKFSNGRKWWQFWKREPRPKRLKVDLDNNLHLGDCFLSQNEEFDIGLTLYEIHGGLDSKYYSFAPVLLDSSKSLIDKFKHGHIKFQPNLGSGKYGIPGIGIISQERLEELMKSYHKVGKISFKRPIPKSVSTSYLLDFKENSLTKFVEQLEWNFSDKQRKKIPVKNLIK